MFVKFDLNAKAITTVFIQLKEYLTPENLFIYIPIQFT